MLTAHVFFADQSPTHLFRGSPAWHGRVLQGLAKPPETPAAERVESKQEQQTTWSKNAQQLFVQAGFQTDGVEHMPDNDQLHALIFEW